MILIIFGLGFFTLLSIPVFATTRALGLPDGGAAVINLVLQVAVLAAILVVLVRIYGNAFARTPPNV